MKQQKRPGRSRPSTHPVSRLLSKDHLRENLLLFGPNDLDTLEHINAGAALFHYVTEKRLDVLHGAKDAVRIVMVYNRALRLSGATDERHTDESFRAGCRKLSLSVGTYLHEVFKDITHPAPRAVKNAILHLLIRTSVLECHSRLLADAFQQLRQRPSRRNVVAAKHVLEEVALLFRTFRAAADAIMWDGLFHHPETSGRPDADASYEGNMLGVQASVSFEKETLAVLRSSNVMNSWAACFLEVLTIQELTDHDAANLFQSIARACPRIISFAALDLGGLPVSAALPAMRYMLMLHVVRFTAALDGGTDYGIPPEAPVLPLFDAECRTLRREQGGVVDPHVLLWALLTINEWLKKAKAGHDGNVACGSDCRGNSANRSEGGSASGSGSGGSSTGTCNGSGSASRNRGGSCASGSGSGSSSTGASGAQASSVRVDQGDDATRPTASASSTDGGGSSSGASTSALPRGNGSGRQSNDGALAPSEPRLPPSYAVVLFDLSIRLMKASVQAWVVGRPSGRRSGLRNPTPFSLPGPFCALVGQASLNTAAAALAAHPTPSPGTRRRHIVEGRLQTLWATYVDVMNAVMDSALEPSGEVAPSASGPSRQQHATLSGARTRGSEASALLTDFGYAWDMSRLVEDAPSWALPGCSSAALPSTPSAATAAILGARAIPCAELLLRCFAADQVALFNEPYLWHELLQFAPLGDMAALVSTAACTVRRLKAHIDASTAYYMATEDKQTADGQVGIPTETRALFDVMSFRVSSMFAVERLCAAAENLGPTQEARVATAQQTAAAVGCCDGIGTAGLPVSSWMARVKCSRKKRRRTRPAASTAGASCAAPGETSAQLAGSSAGGQESSNGRGTAGPAARVPTGGPASTGTRAAGHDPRPDSRAGQLGLLWSWGSVKLLPVLCQGLRSRLSLPFGVESMGVDRAEEMVRILDWCGLLVVAHLRTESRAETKTGQAPAAAAQATQWLFLLMEPEQVDLFAVLAAAAVIIRDNKELAVRLGAAFVRLLQQTMVSLSWHLEHALQSEVSSSPPGTSAASARDTGGGGQPAASDDSWEEPLSYELLRSVLGPGGNCEDADAYAEVEAMRWQTDIPSSACCWAADDALEAAADLLVAPKRTLRLMRAYC